MTGMSGTGKSSALAELRRRGYRVVDTDDPGWKVYRPYAQPRDELHREEWLWVEERMRRLLDVTFPSVPQGAPARIDAPDPRTCTGL